MSNQILERFREYVHAAQFNALRIGLSSPEKIKSLSYGEVKKIETINYRTLKPERDGLFCARIFGPVKDWECNCGKYKRMKHRGIVCEKCGVEVIQARVRRERMGHIDLVSPVCHIWYLKGIPSYLGLIMDMPVKDIERVVYYDAYIVINPGRSGFAAKSLLNAAEYEAYLEGPYDEDFFAETGAEGIRQYLKTLDLEAEKNILSNDYAKSTSVAAKHKLMRRIKVFSSLMHSNLRPEWMILTILPVLPPDLRPLVPLEGGRFASSDLNELYRRVLNRNIRLQRLMEIEAPSVIIKNEKRMLQEVVDALIDNGRRGQPIKGPNKRPLKSLSEMLRGKQGRFRQNLLGKRVDYSGRSVIVADPELKMDRCGLPKIMALELFKSHVYAQLLERDIAPNLKVAKRLVEEATPEVWDVLEDVVKDYPVLLNRAPTLHRLGILAFYPTLVDGKAIKIHPLFCGPFNADFDGDQMAVHVPLSKKSILECKDLVLSVKNILSPASGRPVTTPGQDMVIGNHYLTKMRLNSKGENTVFSNVSEALAAHQMGQIDLHAKVKLRLDSGKIVETTMGRIIIFDALPKGSDFSWINKILDKSDLVRLIEKIYDTYGPEASVITLDKIKKLGFYYATMSGISFSMGDLLVPSKKDMVVDQAEKEVNKIENLYVEGIITEGERHNKVTNIWHLATAEVASQISKDLSTEDKEIVDNKDKSNKRFNPIFMMLESKARGSKDQIKQMIGMRGLMTKPSGEVMETPIKNNFKKGLDVFEYFISTHGARKGQADTALKTANSGYLTRRLVDVSQDVVVTINDCKTLAYVEIEDLKDSGSTIYSVAQRVFGRVAAQDIVNSLTGEIVIKQGELIKRSDIPRLEELSLSKLKVRSVLGCQARRGVCANCYGMDLSKGSIVDSGCTVGIIAAQSIGEPGTQLTLRTFHIGGIANLSEQSNQTAKYEGTILIKDAKIVTNKEGHSVVMSRKAKLAIVSQDGRELQSADLEYGSIMHVQEGDFVKIGQKLVEWDANNKVLMTEHAGKINFVDLIENVTFQERFDEAINKSTKVVSEQRGDKFQPAISILDKKGDEVAMYFLQTGSCLTIENGTEVKPGDMLVKIPRGSSRSKDITGSLPRIAELFEARMPKDPAILADMDGIIQFGGLHRGLRKISLVNGSESVDYFVSRSKQLNVVNGDYVSAGDQISSGVPILHDILRISGADAVQRYLVNQIQEIYRLQGQDINDRHIEVVVRQMLRKVRVTDPGDTDFLIGDRVDKIHFKNVNAALVEEGKKPATGKPVLMGITLASLGTESFISAASFQETTKILAEAAISGQVDNLYGLKENVIIGKLIPGGTGIKSFRNKYIGS